MGLIELSKGKRALVDDADEAWLSQYPWHASTCGGRSWYAIRNRYVGNYRSERTYMHVLIARPERGLFVDHIDGDGLNNQRANLRVVSASENARHQIRVRANKTSLFKGVSWSKSRNAWRAEIRAGDRRADGRAATIVLGTFTDEIAAARSYDAAALEHFGEFAALNFPKESNG